MLSKRTQKRGHVSSDSVTRKCPSQAVHRGGKQIPGLQGQRDRRGE